MLWALVSSLTGQGRTGFLPFEMFPFRLRERTAGGGSRPSLHDPLGPWPTGPHAKQEEHPAHTAAECADFCMWGEGASPTPSAGQEDNDRRWAATLAPSASWHCHPSSEPRLPTVPPGTSLSGSLHIGVSLAPREPLSFQTARFLLCHSNQDPPGL